MDKLTKSQKQEMATALSILALHDGGAEVSTNQINALLEATGNEVEAFLPIIFGNFFNTPEKIEKLIAFPSTGSGGGGGGGGGAAAVAEDVQEEEKVEEEEADMGGGIDMFGGGDGGKGGDY